MDIVMQLLTNRVLISAILGWFTAQLIKMIIEAVKGGFSVKRLKGGGGMPSTHSSTVSSLCAACFICEGPGSAAFAVSFFLALIVIYDAMGVRYTTGRQSRILNRIMERDRENGVKPVSDEVLDEKMGHTFPEIIVGILIGIAVAGIVCNLIK